ncbi:nucleotidyltransferase family protein [Candidatus Poriferisodalis sp.]|uniref:nucleotidyltransferase family protein n=1 Tax=Candidatus Poriferisodalis sp. TaxID=3101277 RepID=UPI003B52E8B9
MRRVTVTIPDNLEAELDRFIAQQPALPSVTAVLQASLEQFLAQGGGPGRSTQLDRVLRSRRHISATARKYGISDIRIFGSVARGEARPDSDIDILVSTGRGTGLFDLARLRMELEQLLEAPVHLATDGGMTDAQREAVLAEAITL